MATDSWGGVRARIRRLRWSRHRGKVFGADGHRFALRPPLRLDQLAQIEAQFGTALPEEYRSFLTTVGAGGAGPGYGLFPLARDRAAGRWAWLGDGAELTDLDALARDFAPGDLSGDQHRLQQQLPPPQDTDAYASWQRSWEDLLHAPGRTDGAACVCHLGCGWQVWLILHGPDAGRIWLDDRGAGIDLEPALGRDGNPHTFTSWYLSWLAGAESTITS
ncbi:MAG TPA: SMI1/KNR4 family protein [Kineosporiaceae bacterium]